MLDINEERKNDFAFFAALNTQMKNGGYEALMYLLTTRDISAFNHRQRPETSALTTQKLYSLRAADRAIYDMLVNRSPPVAKVAGARIFVSTLEIYDYAKPYCSETALGRALARHRHRPPPSARIVVEEKEEWILAAAASAARELVQQHEDR